MSKEKGNSRKDAKTRKTKLRLSQPKSPNSAKPRNARELELEIKLALVLSTLDPDRGFSLLASAIDQINELMEATARVANFGSFSVSIKDNEFSMASQSSVPGLSALLSQDLVRLAESDFVRARGVFDKFQRPEIRVAAYLGLSSAILEPKPDCTCTSPNSAKKSDN